MNHRLHQLILVAVGLLCLSLEVQAQASSMSALVVVGAGHDVSADLIDDVNEAVAFAVGRSEQIVFVPKERVREALGYRSPREPGSCSFDDECIRRQRKGLKVKRFIVVRLTVKDGGYRIHVIDVAEKADADVSLVGQSTASSSDLINQTRRLVRKLLAPSTTLEVRTNLVDATIEVGGKQVGVGRASVVLPLGTHVIRVSKEGYTRFETSVTCVQGQKCVVQANLAKAQKGSQDASPSSWEDTLRITGWSTLGVGVAMTVVGAVFGVRALSLQQELDDACDGNLCQLTREEMTTKLSSGDDAAAIYNTVGIPGMVLTAGGALMVVMSYLHLFEDDSGAARIVPMVRLDGSVGAQAEWRF